MQIGSYYNQNALFIVLLWYDFFYCSGSTSSLTGSSSSSGNANNAASSEVKQKLQVFLMKKREQAREMTNGTVSQTSTGSGTANYRNWYVNI